MKNKSLLGSKKLDRAVVTFFEDVPPQRISRGLRNLLIDYLTAREDGRCRYIDDLLIDIQWLFDLLDTAEEEMKKVRG